MIQFDVTVIGAGVVGISIAKSLSESGLSVLLLEKENRYGTGTSSRNSETIHAGIYYQPGTLKGKLCHRGKNLLYDYCQKNNVPHRKCGKLFIANTISEVERLDLIKKNAFENGIENLQSLDEIQLKKIEPELKAKAAILSPESGIIDSESLMNSLLNEFKVKHGIFLPLSTPHDIERIQNGWRFYLKEPHNTKVVTKLIINSAGLNAIELAQKVFKEKFLPLLYPLKGSYLKLAKKSPIHHIIYPALIPGVIEERVDAVPDLSGGLRFGPDVSVPTDLNDFKVSETLIKKFLPGIQKYLPQIQESDLQLCFAGIRPRIYSQSEKPKDFHIQWDETNGALNLLGMESPALTACLGIAELVDEKIKEKL